MKVREQVVQLVPLPLSMIAVLVNRLNQSIKAIAWAVEKDFVLPYRTLQDAHTDLVMVSPGMLFEPETFDRLESSPLHLPIFTEFWSQIAILIDLAIISYCGAHLVAAPEHYSALSQYAAPEISISAGSSCFSQASLACMSSFVQNKRIWVLQKPQPDNKPVEGAYLSTTVAELSDVWGPMCQWTKDPQSMNGKSRKCYYTIGPGVIAGWPGEPLPSPVALGDEALCHYLPSRKIPDSSEGTEIAIERYQKLLIGAHDSHDTVSLVKNKDCDVT